MVSVKKIHGIKLEVMVSRSCQKWKGSVGMENWITSP